MPNITIQLNGDPRTFKVADSDSRSDKTTHSPTLFLSDVIRSLGISEAGLIAEVNGTFYKEQFDTIRLFDGDSVELVHFMGGG